MFNNVGEKIKFVARAFMGAVFVISAIAGLGVIFDHEKIGLGILIIVGGILSGWVISLFLYGFGQLVSNSDVLVMRKTTNTSINLYYFIHMLFDNISCKR